MSVLSLSGMVGCSGTGSATDFNKGFLDPTAVGRYQSQPLVVPILSSLDRSVDVGNQQFRGAADVRQDDLEPSKNDYSIGRNDLVSISITDLVAPNVETVRTNRVSESGMVSLPIVGQVKAAGLTEAQLEQSISKAYADANVIQHAQVSVSVTEARARTFSILGSVAAPGQYAILNSEFRVLDALVLARDVNSLGIDYIYVIRQVKSDNQPASPETRPATPANSDVLTPHGDAASARTAILAQASPSTIGTTPAVEDDSRIISVDGKEVKVSGEAMPSTMRAATAPTTEAVMPADAAKAGTPAPMAMPAPVTLPAEPQNVAMQQPFDFKDPVAEGKTRVIRIPYQALRDGDLRYNIIIKPYDLIEVPQPVSGEYYMGGHVARVGVYTLTARKITLKQAIVSAGMFDQLAVPARTDIVRRVGDDKEIFVALDLDKVFDGTQPDIYLKPNDVVTVGTSWWAPFMAAVRGGFRMTYGFGFLYDRNFADYADPFGMGGRAKATQTTTIN